MTRKGFAPIVLLVVAGLVIATAVTWSFFQKAKIQPLKLPSNEVIVTTDKTEYDRGETVKITARNNLDTSIYYISDNCDPGYFDPERLKDNNWEKVEKISCVVFGARSELGTNVPSEQGGDIDFPLRREVIDPDGELNQDWEPLKRTGLDGATYIETGTYRISFSYGLIETTYNEKTVYSNEFTIKEKEYSDYGPIIDVNLTIGSNNTVTEAEPIEVTAGRRTSPSVLKPLEGDYVLEVGTKIDRLRMGTILWNQSFPVYFDYTGPVEEGADYSKIKYGQVPVSFKIPYEPEMKAIRLWYLKATVDWSKAKQPKIIFFKELPKFYSIVGAVTDQGRLPIKKASVLLFQNEKPVETVYTDEKGEYKFQEIKSGKYAIRVEPPLSANVLLGYRDGVTVEASEVTTINFTLKPCGSIAGKIIDSQGKPLADAFAEIVGFETPQNHVSDDGTYIIPYLDPGEYRVKAEVKIGKDYIEISPKSVKVELGKTSTVNFVLGE